MLLLESFSYLDEDLLERSETPARRAAWRAWTGLAACLALVAALALPRFAATGTPSVAGQQSAAPDAEASEREWDAAYTPAPGETDEGDAAANGAAAMLPEGMAPSRVITMVESYKLDADACYVPPKNGEVNRSMPLRAAMEEYGDGVRYRVVIELFRDEQPLDWSGDMVRAESDRLGALGYIVAFEQVFDHEALQASFFTLHATRDQLADFPADGAYGYMLYLYAERAPERSADASVVVNDPALAPHGKPFDPVERAPEAIDGEIAIDSAGTDAFAGETLTQEQAYADAALGAYLCAPPAGFGEREFVRADGVLTAVFLRGYDYVEWHVSRDAEADALDAADLAPELVAERMVRHADAGDTDGWRIMGFRVRYAGGVVVSVTAKGVTAEWLYGQLDALR